MKKIGKIILMVMVAVFLVTIPVEAASSGYFGSGGNYGSVVAYFSGSYGCFSATVNPYNEGEILLVAAKYSSQGVISRLDSTKITSSNRSVSLTKNVGATCNKIQGSITYYGNTVLSQERTR